MVRAFRGKERCALRALFSDLFWHSKVLLSPFQVYPFVGMAVSAWFKALGTSRFLHQRVSFHPWNIRSVIYSPSKQYFQAKKMSDKEIAVFMQERKWDYRVFGFTAALLEGLPIIGLVFTVSNRVGAAMWAHGTSFLLSDCSRRWYLCRSGEKTTFHCRGATPWFWKERLDVCEPWLIKVATLNTLPERSNNCIK